MVVHHSVEAAGAVEEPVQLRTKKREEADMDITPMIDITFLLLIFFLVASKIDESGAVELPPAEHGGGVSQKTTVIFTVAVAGADKPAKVFLGDGTGGEQLSDDPEEQKRAIAAAVEEGFNQGKEAVLVKAERTVKHRDVARVAEAVGSAEVDDVHLHLAVFEQN